MQQVVSHCFEQQNNASTTAGKVTEAACSGALGGIPAAFVGNILLQQQLHNTGPKEAFSKLLSQGGARLFKGVAPLMLKESIFGFCYLKAMDDAGNYASIHAGQSYMIPAQVGVGILGSLVSHPFDTMATTMQRHGYDSSLDAAKHLWKEGKTKAFYKGGGYRVLLFTSTMWVTNKVKDTVLEQLDSRAEQSRP